MNDTVLIIDDSLTVRMDLTEAFEAAGFSPRACATIAQAREALNREPVGVVVLDVLLPDGDGVELLREVRASPSTSNTTVLMLSTEAEVKDRIRGLQTGADEYVGKPYDTSYVVAKARELLRTRRAGTAAGRPTVLIIDDSITFREQLRQALENTGYAVATATTGEDGLRVAADQRPNAIVVDGVLPGIDGATVIRRLRLDAALRGVPCLLLTASDDRDAELRALDAGADAFVRKEEDVEVILARLAATLRSAATAPADETASLLGPKKILAVDDSLTYLQELAATLRDEGYDVALARSGEEALELLAVQPVDCILLDLLMPGLSGQETCRRIKSAPVVRDIPLIMLTALEDRAAMLDGLGAGADDYIQKSSEFEVLKARVRAQIRRKQFEDENRRIREELMRKGLEAAEARAAKELAETRAALVEQLENKNRELETAAYEARRAEETLRAVTETGSDAIVSADQKGTIVYANPAAEQLFGYALAELLGQSLTRLMPERFHQAHWAGFRRYLSGGPAHVIGKGIVELAGRRKDGSEFPLELSLGEWRTKGERHFTAIIRDITVRRETQERIRLLNEDLEQRAAALIAANKEMEAFSYSVSHDLRAPLRSIDGFSQALLEDYAGKLDTKGADYLRRVRAAAQRMAALIDDLLKLSRITRAQMTRSPVNLSMLAADIASELKQSQPERSVEICIEPNLEADGDRELLRVALDNLLGNAWKFTGKKPNARIELGSRTDGSGQRTYFVRDNGAGFDMAYVDKLFGVFQRLHAQEEFPGTGIGLATVQRIIHRHGGRVWAEGRPGEEATFYFTL